MAETLTTALFYLYAAAACGFACAVALSSHVVRMAFYLVLSLSATAGLFFLAGADFVGAMQLMIYVGGTLVLLIFGVMLTAQERFVNLRTPPAQLALTGLMGLGLLVLLVTSAVRTPEWRTGPQRPVAAPPTVGPIAMAMMGLRVDEAGPPPGAPAKASSGPAGYLLPFELVSVHLLVVLVGAAYLARTRITVGTRRDEPAPAPLLPPEIPKTAEAPPS